MVEFPKVFGSLATCELRVFPDWKMVTFFWFPHGRDNIDYSELFSSCWAWSTITNYGWPGIVQSEPWCSQPATDHNWLTLRCHHDQLAAAIDNGWKTSSTMLLPQTSSTIMTNHDQSLSTVIIQYSLKLFTIINHYPTILNTWFYHYQLNHPTTPTCITNYQR